MKTISSIAFVAIFLLSTFNSQAQDKGDFRGITALTTNHVSGSIGLHLGAEYMLSNRLSGVASWSFASDSGSTDLNDTLLSADLRYYFIKKRINFYGFTGFGFHRQRLRFNNGFEPTGNYGSFLLGAGVDIALNDKLDFFIQRRGWGNEEGGFKANIFGLTFRLNKE